MANPQLEDGFFKMANEIQDAFCRTRIPGEARQILDFIIRKTYGFNKKDDVISLSQFVQATGIHKSHIQRAVKKLLAMNMVTQKGNKVTQKGNTNSISYSFNKDYDSWKPLPKKVTLPKKATRVTQKGNKRLPKKGHTKDIKDIIKNSSTKVELIKPENMVVKFENFWKDLYQDRFKIPYDVKYAKERKLIKNLLNVFNFEMLCKMATAFLKSKDEWITKAGFTIQMFSAQANKMAQIVRSNNETKPGKYAGLEQNI